MKEIADVAELYYIGLYIFIINKISNREKILTTMEDPDKKAELQRLIDEAPATPKKCVPFFDEDIVPSLPPDWKPPSFS